MTKSKKSIFDKEALNTLDKMIVKCSNGSGNARSSDKGDTLNLLKVFTLGGNLVSEFLSSFVMTTFSTVLCYYQT